MRYAVTHRLNSPASVQDGVQRLLHSVRDKPKTIHDIALAGAVLTHQKSKWLKFQSGSADASEALENETLDA
jgi:hypothetical protein